MSGTELECEYRRAPLSTVVAIICAGLAVLFTMGALARGAGGAPVSGAQPVYAVAAVALGVIRMTPAALTP